jgi:hypothetical protein
MITRNDSDSVTKVPASLKRCVICKRRFYGRADASYCTNSCRQKAYRRRSADVVTSLPAGPVPDGDEWIQDRFGMCAAEPVAAGRHRARDLGSRYPTSSVITQITESKYNSKAVQQIRIAEAEDAAARTIRYYVRNVAEIARYDSAAADLDFDTPLGDALPAALDAATAAGLAAELNATLPRLRELASLLERRARTTTQRPTPPVEERMTAATTAVPLPIKKPMVSIYDGHNSGNCTRCGNNTDQVTCDSMTSPH